MLTAAQENFGHASRVKDLVDMATGATQLQARGVADITAALPQLEQVRQCGATSAEESAELSSAAERLSQIAKHLSLIVDGTTA